MASPEQTGSFEIPPITLSYFNPDSKSYETAKTSPLHIEVTAGAGGSVAASRVPNAVSQPSHGGERAVERRAAQADSHAHR